MIFFYVISKIELEVNNGKCQIELRERKTGDQERVK